MTKIEEALAKMEGKSDSLHSDALKLLADAKQINQELNVVTQPTKDTKEL